MKYMALLCALIAIIACGCGEKQNQNEPITASDFQLDTVVTLSIYGQGDKSLLNDAFGEIGRYDKLLSRTNPGSDTYRLEQNAGEGFVAVSSDTIFLLKESEKYSRLSGGLFDVTIGPLVSLWNIHDGTGHYPTEEELDSAMALVNYEDVLIDGDNAMLKRKGMAADFGAIAKGYIADRVKEFLIGKGVKSGIINLGGNVVLIGGKPDGGDFHIGLQDPDAATGEYMGIVGISDKSIVTSGPYERFFMYEGKRYHHIIDPKTGFPSDNGLIQVTVISDDSVTGDALSTTLFLMGLEDGMKLAGDTPGVSAIFVTTDKKVYLSSGFDTTFNITNPEYSLAP